MKLPNGVGLKKTKAIESMCQELGLETQPPCTDDICNEFNELRSEMVLLYELKNALTNRWILQHNIWATYRNFTLDKSDFCSPASST
jgi:hypothetical protein